MDIKFKPNEKCLEILNNVNSHYHCSNDGKGDDVIDSVLNFKWNFSIDLSFDRRQEFVDLIEKCMGDKYELTKTFKFDPSEKLRELIDPRTVLLFLTTAADDVVAFTQFKFDYDYEYFVGYLYEIHVIKEYRRLRIATFFLDIIKECALAQNVEKMVCTIVKGNEESIKFFTHKHHFLLDDTDPTLENFHDEDYFIYSLPNKSFKKQEMN
ncbi:hypothetical protein SNEBB_001337 [Seison nebaliae]|nr:hypothetical protein SNEBB_001337 [Seison nebaliae]